MRTFRHTVAGQTCEIHVPEHDDDLEKFYRFLEQGDRFLAYDTETTGLDVFAPGHQLRLFQIGNSTEAWVLRTDKFADACRRALRMRRNLIAHNAPYDSLVIDRHLGIPVESLLPKTWDTKIMAHLLDPRSKEEGGVGLGLKPLSSVYVDPEAPDTQAGLTKVFNYFGWTKKTGWARIAIDHSQYLIYAGLDVILDHRLFDRIYPATMQYPELCKMEHRLQYLLTLLMRKGMRIDVAWAEMLELSLHNEFVDYCEIAMDYGVDNVFSTEQVSAQLVAMGEELTERTPEGALKVDKAVLEPLADLDRFFNRIGAREPNPVADAVMRAKRAKKWSESYVTTFLEWRDHNDRLHPTINSLQARTARMSVSNPPLQQLPASDVRVRRAFIADPGFLMISSDYKQVEMRVLAALSNDWTMRDAIARGEDLHSFTALRVFGEGFTDKQKKIAKNIGFGKVYGGGAAGVARLTGAEEGAVREAMLAYDATFPGIKRFSQKLMREAQRGIKEVVTPIGRRLPLDDDRLYAATNYMVQSTARDLLAQAVIRLFEAGLGDYVLLPVHDEILGQAPEKDAEEIVNEISAVMTCEFQGVKIASDAEVLGTSWTPGIMPMDLPERKEQRLRAGQWTQEALLF